MGQAEVLISKLVAVDGLSTSSIVVGEVTALCDERTTITKTFNHNSVTKFG